ncbi:MAG: hypothetical protein EA376_06040 [Phycisphaeraceae bacterium]|nr:MAG: hypothetical protein EA376_06040 [Phycisphaeraceae bacterium]
MKMKTALRCVGAFAAGLVAVGVMVVAIEFFGLLVHPVPEGFEGTPEEVRRHVEIAPAWFLAAAIPMWAAAAFAGVWIAGRLGNRGCALGLGLLLLAAVFLNISMLPYPVWSKIGAPVGVAAGGVLGLRLSAKGGGGRSGWSGLSDALR